MDETDDDPQLKKWFTVLDEYINSGWPIARGGMDVIVPKEYRGTIASVLNQIERRLGAYTRLARQRAVVLKSARKRGLL